VPVVVKLLFVLYYHSRANHIGPDLDDHEDVMAECRVRFHSVSYNLIRFIFHLLVQLNLVCQDQGMVTLANSILMGGLLAGSVVLGTLSDM
jgi:hypothetical protein